MPGHKKLVLLFFAVHLLWVFYIFPVNCLLNSQSIYNVDYPFHYYNAYAAKQFVGASGRIWGYDPFFLAGYPANVYSDLDNKWVEAALCFVPQVIFAFAFKLLVLFAFLAAPFLMYLAALNFDAGRRASLVSLALSIFIWNAGRYTYLKIINGMFSYVLACFACLFFLSLVYRYFRDPETKAFVRFAAAAAVFPLIHALIVVAASVPVFFAYLMSLPKKRAFHFSLILAVLIVLIVNFFWIKPFLAFSNYKILLGDIRQPVGIGRFLADLFIGVEANIGFFMLLFGLHGLYLMWGRGERLKTVMFSCLFLWTFFLAYFGGYYRTLLEMEPYRFRFLMMLSLVIPAASSMTEVLPVFYRRIRARPVFLAVFWLFIAASLYPVAEKQLKRANLHCDLPPEYHMTVDYLKASTGRDARILVLPYSMVINDRKGDEGFWVMLLPILTGREVIHDLVDFHPIKNVSAFRKVFKPGIFSLAEAELAGFLDTYNIGYVVSWNEDPKTYLKHRMFSVMKTIGKFNVYRVNMRSSYFLQGSGDVSATYNKISVRNASNGSVVLKYHWFENLKTRPELKIEPYRTHDDPVGFIRVYNGSVKDFDIYCAY